MPQKRVQDLLSIAHLIHIKAVHMFAGQQLELVTAAKHVQDLLYRAQPMLYHQLEQYAGHPLEIVTLPRFATASVDLAQVIQRSKMELFAVQQSHCAIRLNTAMV